MRRLRILWYHEYDIIESRDVIDDVINRCAMGIFQLETNPLNRCIVSEIFNTICGQTDRHTDTHVT